jgi:hypothetical protein
MLKGNNGSSPNSAAKTRWIEDGPGGVVEAAGDERAADRRDPHVAELAVGARGRAGRGDAGDGHGDGREGRGAGGERNRNGSGAHDEIQGDLEAEQGPQV